MDIAAVLHGKEEVVPVPDGLADVGVGPALTIQGIGEDGSLPAGRRNNCDLAVPRIVPDAGDDLVGDPVAVGRPRREVAGAVAVRDSLQLSRAIEPRDEDVSNQVGVPIRMASRTEGDPGAIG